MGGLNLQKVELWVRQGTGRAGKQARDAVERVLVAGGASDEINSVPPKH